MPFAGIQRGVVLTLSLAGLLAPSVFSSQVIAWVAPYRVNETKEALQADFGGVGMKDGLTYLAMQFWFTNGAEAGQDANVAGPEFDNTVKWFRDWSHENGIRATLCVHNWVDTGWSWTEVMRSIRDNRTAFVQSLVRETERLGLDGVELDLEGGDYDTALAKSGPEVLAQRNAYVTFVKELSDSLRGKGKTLTLATFPSQWNAPNSTWWLLLLPAIDGMATMGYEAAGRSSTHGFSYANQKSATKNSPKLMIGMRSDIAGWEGDTLTRQLDWLVEDGVVGLGIWEASLRSPEWRTAEVWNRIAAIKKAGVAPIRQARGHPLQPAGKGSFYTAKGRRIHRAAEPLVPGRYYRKKTGPGDADAATPGRF